VSAARPVPPRLRLQFTLQAGASSRRIRSVFKGADSLSSAGGSRDEAGGGDRGVEQDAEVGGGGGGPPLPPQGVQPLRQAHLQVHGARRGRRLQHRRPGREPLTAPHRSVSSPPLRF